MFCGCLSAIALCNIDFKLIMSLNCSFPFQLIGKVGRVHHFTSKKDVVVEYKGSSKVWTLNARALTKVSVRIGWD